MPGDRRETRAQVSLGAAIGLAVLFVLLAFLAREPNLDGPGFGEVWPAGGFAVLWFLVRDARLLSIDSVLLALAAAAANAVLGADPELSAVFVLAAVAQTLVAVWLLRRWCPGLWGSGGERPLDRPRVLAHFGSALALAMAVGTVIGTLGAWLVVGQPEPVGGALFFGRNFGSALIVVSLGVLVGARIASTGPRPPLAGDASRAEVGAAVLFTGAMYALAFYLDDLPLVFPLLGATVWFGLRFSTLVTAGHLFVVGLVTQGLTMNGIGPFAAVETAGLGVLLAEAYVATIVVTGLVLSTGRDERQSLADELRRANEGAVYEMLVREAVISSMAEGLIVLDEAGEVLIHNASAAEMFGAPVDEAAWRRLTELSSRRSDGTPMVVDEWPTTRALGGEAVHDTELLITLPDGTDRIFCVSAIPLPRDEARRRTRALVIFRDISEEHANREELAAFAGVVAHDLRNPLAAIDGWTEMIADELDSGSLDAQLAREFVSRVRSASRRMRELIRDLLAHATSSQRDLDVGRVDVSALVTEVAAARHADDKVRVDPVPPVLADPVLVRQVLDNLVGNALKYVCPEVEPEITVRGCRSDTRFVTIQVADNGIGIPPGENEKIFEEFHRAHYRDYEGSGLGLAIVRRIITRHDGTIVARPNPCGQGSVFEFTLPAYEG